MSAGQVVNEVFASAILSGMFGELGVTGIAVFVVILFMSIAVHETMHAYVAYKLGDDLAHAQGRISLNPLDHIDPMFTIALPALMIFMGLSPILAAKPVPINTHRISGDEWGLAAVGLAGPFTNLVLAVVGALVFRSMGFGGLRDIVELFVRLNVALFVFNMMPIPPLDGSRFLYAVAPAPVQRLMEQIEAMGMMMILVLLFVLLPVLGPMLTEANSFILNILIR